MSAAYVLQSNFQVNSILSLGDVQGVTLTSTGLATLNSLQVTTTSQLGAASCASLMSTGAVSMNSGSCTNLFQSGDITTTNATVNTLLSGGTVNMTSGMFTTLTLGTTFDGNAIKLENIGEPTHPMDATTKQYVDNAVASGMTGLVVKQDVRLAELAVPVTPNGNQTVDGVAVGNNERVLLGGQALAKDRVVYITNTAGAWAVAADFAPGENLVNAYVFVNEGATNRDSGWVQTAQPAMAGADPLDWKLFTRNSGTRAYGFIWTADATQNYKATLLSAFAPNTTQKVVVDILQREDALGTPWTGRSEGYVDVDGASNIAYTPISVLSAAGSTLAVLPSGTTGLDFEIQNPSAVARSGYVTITLFSATGNYAAATVSGGTSSMPA